MARYLVAHFPHGLDDAVPEPFRALPQGALLPIMTLARTGALAGTELAAVVSIRVET